MKPNRVSAGVLVYRIRDETLEVLLVHPGGPLFRGKDDGHWSIPKGEPESGEDLLVAARRELAEEVGLRLTGEFVPIGSIRQKGGKLVHAWAVAGDRARNEPLPCNNFTMEWPPGSGALAEFPEIDRAGFFPLPKARRKIKEAQVPFLDRLLEVLEAYRA